MRANEATVGPDTHFKPERTETSLKAGTAPARLPVAMLGVPFDPVTLDDAMERIEEMVVSGRPHQVVTANVDFLVQGLGDVELHRIMLDAQLVLCDGTPLVWASRWLGNPLPERVAGADLAPRIIRLAAEKGYRLFFLGSTPEANERAVANVEREHPGLIIAGHYSPPFHKLLEMDHEEITRRIRAARPDILFVSLGCPKQEKWIAMNYASLGVPVMIGVGAVIDFLAGQFKRAPVWIQRSGVEWIYRLAQEPRRLFRRYAVDLWKFSHAMARQWRAMQFPGRRSRQELRRLLVITDSAWQRVHAPERLDARAITRDAAGWNKIGTRHCLLDASDVEFIDSTGVAWLAQLNKRLRAHDRRLVLISPSAAVARALEVMQMTDYFTIAADAVGARKIITKLNEAARPAMVRTAPNPLLVEDELTAANAEATWLLLESTINACGPDRKHLCIDFSEVRFIDSTGLGVMLRAQKAALRRGLVLHFSGAQPNVRNVLRLARLEAALLEDAA